MEGQVLFQSSEANLRETQWSASAICLYPPCTITGLRWLVIAYGSQLQIGCQIHSYAQWGAFSNSQITAIGPDQGVYLWRQWKTQLLAFRDPAAEEMFARMETKTP